MKKKYLILIKKIGEDSGTAIQYAPTFKLALELAWRILPRPLAGYYYQIIKA